MKRNVLQVRLSDKDMEYVTNSAESSGISISEWVRNKLLEDKVNHPNKNPIRHVDKKAVEEEVIVQGLPEYLPVPVGEYHKCKSPGCPSLDTKGYERAAGIFWLCDTHKP